MDKGDRRLARIEEEARNLLYKLLSNRGRFFDNYGRLNSDGMRLFTRVIRILKEVNTVPSTSLDKARRDPTIERIARLLLLVDEEQTDGDRMH